MKKINLGILTFPVSESGVIPLSNLIKIAIPISNELNLITGDAGYKIYKEDKRLKTYEIKHGIKENLLGRALEYLYTQLKFSYKILRIKDVNKWIFFIGGDTLVLPMLTAKILRKEVYLLFAGSSLKTLSSSNDNFFRYAKVLSTINCKLSDNIVLYSKRLIKEWGLEDYKEKILIMHEQFIDFDKFRIITEIKQRKNVIGYIGRLSKEKGIEEFLKSIPELIRINSDLEFLICGDGKLKDEVSKYINDNKLNSKIMLIPWIPHEEVPYYLNQLKLLVIPSYTEGLPNIMLEAMACGTPVLATPVGAILDVIINNKNGFIMKDNSFNCIERNILMVTESHNIDKIIENAYTIVVNEFAFKNVKDRWEKIIE